MRRLRRTTITFSNTEAGVKNVSSVLSLALSTLFVDHDIRIHRPNCTCVDHGESGYRRVSLIRVPSTGGGEAFLSQHGPSFRRAISDLPLSRARWRLARTLLRSASRIGLQRLPLVPHVDVWLPDGEGSLAPDFSVLSGVKDASQKIIVRQHSSSGVGDVIWKAEVRAYHWLACRGFDGVLAPKLLGDGSEGEIKWFKASEIKGTRPPLKLDWKVRGFLDRLREPEAGTQASLKEEWVTKIRTSLEFRKKNSQDCHSREFEGDLALLLVNVERDHLPFGIAHGDLTPWNTRCHEGVILAYDWEWFSAVSSPWFDEIHWTVQTSALVRHDSAETTFERTVDVIAPRGVSRSQAARALGLYAVEVISQGRECPPATGPVPPQHVWLRTLRRTLLDLAMAEMEC